MIVTLELYIFILFVCVCVFSVSFEMSDRRDPLVQSATVTVSDGGRDVFVQSAT